MSDNNRRVDFSLFFSHWQITHELARSALRERIRTHFYLCGESFGFNANDATAHSQSCSRSGSKQLGKGQIHLQDAADRHSVCGNDESSRGAAIPRLPVTLADTLTCAFPREAHGCHQSIPVMLPFIHGFFFTIEPLCHKVVFAPHFLKTKKVWSQVQRFVETKEYLRTHSSWSKGGNESMARHPLKWLVPSRSLHYRSAIRNADLIF